jgi:hypothetical protein
MNRFRNQYSLYSDDCEGSLAVLDGSCVMLMSYELTHLRTKTFSDRFGYH